MLKLYKVLHGVSYNVKVTTIKSPVVEFHMFKQTYINP
jgi:hypothetical protein